MSLLIDALRKAERAKRDAGQSAPTDASGHPAKVSGIAAAPPGRPPQSAAADLAEPYQSITPGGGYTDAVRAFEPAAPATSTGSDSEAAARDSVRILFDAKAAPPTRSRLRTVSAVGALAGVAIAGWVWWEMQPHGSLGAGPAIGAAPVAPAAPRIAAPAPTEDRALVATIAQAQPEPPLWHPAMPVPAPTPSSATASAPTAPSGPPSPDTASPPESAVAAAAPAVAKGRTARRPSAAPHEALAAADPEAAPAAPSPAAGLGPIRRGTPPPGPPPKLAAAYAAYGEGRLDEAGRLYREVLAEFPLNRDAINGLAATALREGRKEEAQRWFRRALALDPRDPIAVAGLANLAASEAPIDTESRLKNLLAATPDAAPAHFALGNALAVQQRWSDAQQAYFRAYALDGDNPDYLFNLAVSLDHLGQAALAGRFYREALNAAARRPAAFDAAAASARLEALTPP